MWRCYRNVVAKEFNTNHMGADLAAYFKQGKHLHIIIEAGHLLMAEYPETINQAIALLRSSVARSPLTVNTKTSTEFLLLLSRS